MNQFPVAVKREGVADLAILDGLDHRFQRLFGFFAALPRLELLLLVFGVVARQLGLGKYKQHVSRLSLRIGGIQ